MKTLLFVVVLLAAVVVGFGFYRGWFRLSTDNTDPNANATITVDQDKFRADKEKVTEKVHDLGQKAKDKSGDPTEKVKDQEHRP